MRDWTDIWSRELLESPPADDFLAGYFKYEPPASTSTFEAGEIDLGLPEFEE